MKKIPNILMRLALLFQFLHSFILFLLPTPAKPSQQNQNQSKKHEKSPQLEKPSDLRKLFDAFDADKDGVITSDELSTSLRKLGIPISDSDLANLIKTVDSNNDGCVDADEFEALYAMLTSEEKEEELKDAFGVFDKDGDGFISEEELKGVLDALGICHGRSLEECRRMIQKVDVDGDGRVSFYEFQVMMKDAAAFVDI